MSKTTLDVAHFNERTSTDFSNFLQRFSCDRILSNDDLLFHLSALPKEHEPLKLSLFSYAAYQKRKCFGLLYLRNSSTNFNNFDM